MYPLGAVFGIVIGGLSSYCRALFGELIPPGSEAAFYALYAITDKGSSVFGPAIVGAITDAYGEIRPVRFCEFELRQVSTNGYSGVLLSCCADRVPNTSNVSC